MAIKITGAPCCWGVDDPNNPYLPPWQKVLEEASEAGYHGIELGPYGYIPIDIEVVQAELERNKLFIVAGTIFDDLVSESNYTNLQKQVHDICTLITKLPKPPKEDGQAYPAPYLVIIDWGHEERDYAAGHPDKAHRLSQAKWKQMVSHIKGLAKFALEEYGVRSVIHPHAGGYIEFADEIDQIAVDIPSDLAGLCLDTGHLYYSKMDPLVWLEKYKERCDYLHFKDIDARIYEDTMKQHIKFFDACGNGVMCPIGEGIIPYKEILDLLEKNNYSGYITIEQERDPRNAGTSLQDVRKSLNYLRSIGY